MTMADSFSAYSRRPNPPALALKTPAGPPDMWVFIDDSGDPGMQLNKGSSRYIVMSACIFRDPKQIENLKSISEQCAAKRSHRVEFKYNNTKDKTKRLYFDLIKSLDFAVRAIYADKELIHSPKLRNNGNALKSYLIKMLLERNWGQITNAKIIIDGNDLAAFDIPDNQYLMGLVNRDVPGTVHSVKFDDSKVNRGIQLADMTAGAIGRHLMNAKANPSRDFDTFRSRTWRPEGTYWNFTRNDNGPAPYSQ
ncbi:MULTISPECIES: DUF3800 domain-containing protein [unclassified Brevibacterium]|uniref:DUF3800 domain-containing protein n=1 Tax=unclassified Brevibacterium TaxID=2614124 RepID=UPI00114D2885|nr:MULTISPECIES: DUF3800 domain-containing protein [unclassified Brevibacterium]